MNDPVRREVLVRLRSRRARGRPEKIQIGARLSALKDRGLLSQAEFDFVMGLGCTEK